MMVVVVPGNVNATLRHDDDDDDLLFPRPPFSVPLPSTTSTTTTTASTTTTSTFIRRRPRATPSATTKVSWPGLVRTLLVVVVAGWGVGVDGYSKLPNGDGSSSTSANTLRGKVFDWIAGGTSRSTVVATYGPIEDWDVSDVTNLKWVFYNFGSFNSDLSKWETGNVTTMAYSKCTLLGVVFFFQTKIGDSHFLLFFGGTCCVLCVWGVAVLFECCDALSLQRFLAHLPSNQICPSG